MKKKMPKKKQKKGGYDFSLTRKETFLWLSVAFLALVWMFTLGVIVGRGMSPVEFDIEKLKKELMALKEEALSETKTEGGGDGETAPDARHLGFYEVLTDKKEEARLKSIPKSSDRLKRRSKEKAKQGEGAMSPPIKSAVLNKDRRRRIPVASVRQEPGAVFTLQVASLKEQNKAEKMVATLKDQGYDAYAVASAVAGKGTYHRVRVGRFTDRDDAIKTASRLRRLKYEPIVMRE